MAAQILLGHSTWENTVRYFGIDVDDALELAKQIWASSVPPPLVNEHLSVNAGLASASRCRSLAQIRAPAHYVFSVHISSTGPHGRPRPAAFACNGLRCQDRNSNCGEN